VQSTGNQDFDVPCYPAAEILTPCETTDSIPKVRGSDPFGIVESSGTTGSAKRIVVSHSDLIERWHRLMAVQKWTKAERYSSQIELYFNSSRRDYNFIFRLGATAVIPTSGSVGEFVQFINKKKITHLRLTPVHLRLMLKLVKGETPLFPDLWKLAVVSAPITGAERAAVRKYICPSLVEAYGSNESGTLTYSTPEMQMIEPESVGRVVTGVEAQIVDENGVEQPAGTPGLARFRASDFPTEYIDNPTATAEKFRDGWYYPGDIAKINDAGYLFLLGRADDVINNAGIKYYPIEIETVLLSHPAVCEAAVFPWQHELAGQVAGAAVVVEGNVTYGQLKEYCAGRLAPYKVPYVIAFRKALPKNAMGKVLKRELAMQTQAQIQAQTKSSNGG
jgi:acyl-coenzyme A synthetase/AMP-(fatty) acid ligase